MLGLIALREGVSLPVTTAHRDEGVTAPAFGNRQAAAVFFGWNDAAWGRPRRAVDAALGASYERGFHGGVVYQEKERRGG